jgi:hypothetical protein
MSQSLFDVPAPVSQAAGVLEQMAEGQEQLRAEMGLMAERLEQLEQSQARLETGAKAALGELERRPAPSRAPLWTAIAALVLASAGLAVALM